MEDMRAFAPYERTVIPRHLTRRATALIRHSAYPADVALAVLLGLRGAGVPAPVRDGVPVFNVDLHQIGG